MEEKTALAARLSADPEGFIRTIQSFRHPEKAIREILEKFSENTISNYFLPYSLAPNFLVNGKVYMVPMVVEESSVVAAASKSAGFWFTRGGFQARVESMRKPGHVYFRTELPLARLEEIVPELGNFLIRGTAGITRSMRERGGGIDSFNLSAVDDMPGQYRLEALFDTVDSMGGNFINTCLEAFADLLPGFLLEKKLIRDGSEVEITMAILSNLTPECQVAASAGCPVKDFPEMGAGLSGEDFVRKFTDAVNIALHDPSRATTHNKGIYNGVDAVLMATGNDYRAAEAGGHAFASQGGTYRSLTVAGVSGGQFSYTLRMPLSLGTVGGLTGSHPLARLSLELLGNPGAKELMMIAASAGLANNFAAIWSLVTSGIQKGHMKMHLGNILLSLGATPEEREEAANHFSSTTVSYSAVRDFLDRMRSGEDG